MVPAPRAVAPLRHQEAVTPHLLGLQVPLPRPEEELGQEDAVAPAEDARGGGEAAKQVGQVVARGQRGPVKVAPQPRAAVHHLAAQVPLTFCARGRKMEIVALWHTRSYSTRYIIEGVEISTKSSVSVLFSIHCVISLAFPLAFIV